MYMAGTHYTPQRHSRTKIAVFSKKYRSKAAAPGIYITATTVSVFGGYRIFLMERQAGRGTVQLAAESGGGAVLSIKTAFPDRDALHTEVDGHLRRILSDP